MKGSENQRGNTEPTRRGLNGEDNPKSFSGPTQLLFKALGGEDSTHPLVALPPEPGVPALLRSRLTRGHYHYFDYAVFRRDRARQVDPDPELVFSWDLAQSGGHHDFAAIFLPKSVPLIEYVLSQVSARLAPGATVQVVGANKSGIRSCRPLVERYVGPVLGSLSGSHSVMLTARKEVTAEPFLGEEVVRMQALGRELEVTSLPGTFSYGRLDDGTGFLLENLGSQQFGRALDFGCGSGVIGAALQLAVRSGRMEFVDSSAMALEATRRTLARNALDPSAVRPSDVLSDARGSFDLIVSNPPFHSGLQTDFGVTQKLIETAGPHLARDGRLVLVANSFINYFRFLRQEFAQVETLAENPKFRLIQAWHPLRRAGNERTPSPEAPRSRPRPCDSRERGRAQ